MKMIGLPHAGGFAMRYSKMVSEIADKMENVIEFVPYEYPGRGEKYKKPFCKNFDELVKDISNNIIKMLGENEPYCLFGHCMGGYAAFSVSYYMQENYNRPPVLLVVSGAATPLACVTQQLDMKQEDTIKYLRQIGGTEEAVLKNKIFEQELLPILKKDLDIIDTYKFKYEGKKLDSYVAVSYGSEDFVAEIGRIEDWRYIAQDKIDIECLPGNHFYYENDMDTYINFLKREFVEAFKRYETKEGGYPLTDIQKSYLLGRNNFFTAGGISTHAYYEFENEIDVNQYEKAFNQTIARHDMLHTIIYPDGYQYTLQKFPNYKIKQYDLTNCSELEKENFLTNHRKEISSQKFETGKWPMFCVEAAKFTENKIRLFYCFDLMVADGSSLRILLRECMKYYEDNTANLPELKMSFREYVLKMYEKKFSKKYMDDKKYWISKLDKIPTSPELSYRETKREEEIHFKRIKFQLDREKWSKIQDKCSKKGILPVVFFLTAYSSVLTQYSRESSFSLNVTLTNRTNFLGKPMHTIGDFTSLLLLTIPGGKAETEFWEQAEKIQGNFKNGYMHHLYDGVLVEQQLVKLDENQKSFPVVFTSLLGTVKEIDSTRIGKLTYSMSQTSQVYLDFQLMETEDGILMTWDYCSEKFKPGQIQDMFDTFENVLTKLALEDKDKIRYMAPVGDKIKKDVESYNNTAKDYERKTLTQLFEDSVKRGAYRTAVTDEGGSYTYEVLNTLSNKIAQYLLGAGIAKGDLVGIETYRQKETIAEILGIMKIGAVYVPVDPSYPEDRKSYIFQKSGVKAVLKPVHIAISSSENGIFECEKIDINSLAYVIFTSGSTGKPKGVMITHKEAVNTILCINEKFHVDQKDRVLGISSMSFDLSVYDIFGSLSVGAELVMVPDIHDVRHLIKLIDTKKISLINCVPPVMQLILGEAKTAELSSVRNILLSGEWISVALAKNIIQNLKKADLYSLGGATEGSVWSIYYPVKEIEEGQKSIPYGYPLNNQSCYVLDTFGQICPYDTVGEIVLGGEGVAEGYINAKELTEEHFIEHKEFGRVYRTGDMGVFRREGYIEILGRIDGQMKLNGFRIERGEIESLLLQQPLVKEARIEIVDIDNKKFLTAYLISDVKLSEEIIAEIKKNIADKLPMYMIPSVYMQIEGMPLTANKKINSKRLKEMKLNREKLSSNFKKPESDKEKILYNIFKDIMETDAFGTDDKFVQIGMDSVTILQILTRINSSFDNKISFDTLIKNDSIEKLASVL